MIGHLKRFYINSIRMRYRVVAAPNIIVLTDDWCENEHSNYYDEYIC